MPSAARPPRTPLRRALAVLRVLVITLVVVAVGATAWAGIASARRIGRVHPVPNEHALAVRTDAAAIARGRQLTYVATCVLCHGEDLGGAEYANMGAIGMIAGPNLTRGRGGHGDALTDADWDRAVRHGVRRDGTSLIMMPSEAFYALTNEDLSAIVAFARSAPPVDREIPASRFGPLGRALLAAGRLPFLVAEKTPSVAHVPAMTAAPTPEYGRYLADIGGCRGCHGFGLPSVWRNRTVWP